MCKVKIYKKKLSPKADFSLLNVEMFLRREEKNVVLVEENMG